VPAISCAVTACGGQLTGLADHPTVLAAELVARATVGTAHGLGHATRRVWSPVLVPAARGSALARGLLLGALAMQVATDSTARDPRRLPLTALDDALAALGLWASCASARTVRPLLPALGVTGGRATAKSMHSGLCVGSSAQ
jgi:hypothetical protein